MSKSKNSDPGCCFPACNSSQTEKIYFFNFPKNLET